MAGVVVDMKMKSDDKNKALEAAMLLAKVR
jgi:hypothetical protein